jgi:[acyl-carrier-protein] S-malonyltransferase
VRRVRGRLHVGRSLAAFLTDSSAPTNRFIVAFRVFLFPGQGSQSVGMGKDLAEQFEIARRRFEEAAHILGFDLARVCFDGPEEELRQTRVTQPALYVHSCILSELLAERGLTPARAAGHSLGEYSALYAAAAFGFADGLRLVKARAEAMQQAGQQNPGTMAAVVGLHDQVVRDVCREAEEVGVVVPANYNSPDQIVISGEVAAVRKAVELAKARGAKLARELPVSGAFHSPLMKPAAESLAEAIVATPVAMPRIPVVSNVTARPHTDAESLRRLLTQQLLCPVRWSESMTELAAGDVEWFEVGSGNVLAGLLKRTIPDAAARTIGRAQHILALS